MNFTQTTDADFNKGDLNNLVVSSNNIILQNAASNAGLWWTGTTFLPQNLTGHKTVTANYKYVYLVGGFNGSTYSNGVYVATIQSSGISAWTALDSLPVGLRDPAVVVGANTIYVMGGRNASQVFNSIYYATINSDGTIGSWQTSEVTLPESLWGHAAVYMNGIIYVTGGANVLSETSALNSVYYTKLKADRMLSAFITESNLPGARNMHGMVSYNNKIYLSGGYDNSGTKTNTVYFAVPDVNGPTGPWSAETDLPVTLSNHASIVTNGLMIILGGATSSSLSNAVYFANLDQVPPLTWITSSNSMFDFIQDGSAIPGNGQVIYTGGLSQAGNILSNSRYATLTLTSNYVNHGVFVSYPFYELGEERLINTLAFTASYNATYANCEVSYRLAGNDKIWGNWTAVTSTSPIAVSQTEQYAQYSVFFTGQTTYNVIFSDMSLTTPGTMLNGNLNAITTFTAAASPYVVFSDISFSSGSHTFEPGTKVLFSPNTGMTVGQASIVCNGNVTDSVKFYYLGVEPGLWNGIYFNSSSNSGVSSQFYYTVIAGGGNGGNNANLYCNSTPQPYLSHCSIRGADGNGIRFNSSDLSLQYTMISGNTENGLYLTNSNPTIAICNISYNGGAGIYANTTSSIINGTTIDHNLYGIRFTSPNLSISQPIGSPTIVNNTYNGIALDGGDITTSDKTWNYLPYHYFLLGTVRIIQSSGNVKLTIKPGNMIKITCGAQIQVGYTNSVYGGELYAVGTADSLITFTSMNGDPGGWNGINFTNYSDYYGGHSQLAYCIVEKGNDYNIYSENTIQPDILNYCIIQDALVDGARYNSSLSSQTIDHTQFLNNGRYPLWFQSVETSPIFTNNTYQGNVTNYIAISGGNYSSDRTFYNVGAPYYTLGSISIYGYLTNPRLTIKPGVTIAFSQGTGLQVGINNSNYGGELFSEGTYDSIITFKPFNNAVGGWSGINFQNADIYTATSSLKYCNIEKGATYNVNIYYTSQISFDHCILDYSGGDGMNIYGSTFNITNCTISNSGTAGIYASSFNGTIDTCIISNSGTNGISFSSSTGSLLKSTISNSGNDGIIASSSIGNLHNCRFLNNNGYPLKYNDVNCDFYLLDNTYSDNTMNYIALSGGYYYDDWTFYNDGIPYHVLDNLLIYNSRVTIEPGVTMAFAIDKYLQVGNYYNKPELYAEGNRDSIITFKPFNDAIGGWGGLTFNYWSNYGGSTSSLKYCIIEKAAVNNILCESTTQPLLDHCILRQSTENGLKLNGSTLVLRNSTFSNNAQNGILLEGGSNLTFGNSSDYTCNFYNNGAYNIYNNSTSNVNAKYNFWGKRDSVEIKAHIYDKSDDAAKGTIFIRPFFDLPYLITDSMAVAGVVKYANEDEITLNNAKLKIKDYANLVIDSAMSNSSGQFAFDPILSNSYKMTITPGEDWGGANSTDALLILNHFTHISLLSGINLAAADVNKSYTVNATDALFVMGRFVENIDEFPAGYAFMEIDTIGVDGEQVTNNLKMLWFGDVNASFAPSLKSPGSDISLAQDGSLLVPSFNEFDVPVKIKGDWEIGAISLGLYYPEEFFRVQGVELKGGFTNFTYSAKNGLFRIAWCDPQGLIIKDQEVLITLKMKSLDLAELSPGQAFEIYEHSEFADRSAKVLKDIVLLLPEIQHQSYGISELPPGFNCSAFPNPFSDNCLIGFTLDRESKVSISLYNCLGERMEQGSEAVYGKGNHEIKLNASDLTPGIYLLKFEILSGRKSYSMVVKVMVSR